MNRVLIDINTIDIYPSCNCRRWWRLRETLDTCSKMNKLISPHMDFPGKYDLIYKSSRFYHFFPLNKVECMILVNKLNTHRSRTLSRWANSVQTRSSNGKYKSSHACLGGDDSNKIPLLNGDRRQQKASPTFWKQEMVE